jgi:hypothetical protein
MVVWRLQRNGRAVTRQGMRPSGPTTTQSEHVADNMLGRNGHVSVNERA